MANNKPNDNKDTSLITPENAVRKAGKAMGKNGLEAQKTEKNNKKNIPIVNAEIVEGPEKEGSGTWAITKFVRFLTRKTLTEPRQRKEANLQHRLSGETRNPKDFFPPLTPEQARNVSQMSPVRYAKDLNKILKNAKIKTRIQVSPEYENLISPIKLREIAEELITSKDLGLHKDYGHVLHFGDIKGSKGRFGLKNNLRVIPLPSDITLNEIISKLKQADHYIQYAPLERTALNIPDINDTEQDSTEREQAMYLYQNAQAKYAKKTQEQIKQELQNSIDTDALTSIQNPPSIQELQNQVASIQSTLSQHKLKTRDKANIYYELTEIIKYIKIKEHDLSTPEAEKHVMDNLYTRIASIYSTLFATPPLTQNTSTQNTEGNADGTTESETDLTAEQKIKSLKGTLVKIQSKMETAGPIYKQENNQYILEIQKAIQALQEQET